MKYIKAIFFLFLSVVGVAAFAQQKDFEIWTGIKYKTIHTKRVASTVSAQSRFHENSTRFLAAFADFNLAYKISKNIEVSGAYVFLQKNNLRYGLRTYHQYYAGINLEKKLNDFEVSYDFILQNNHKDFIQDSRERIPSSFFKNKVKVQYKVKKSYYPYLYSDLRHKLTQQGIAETNRLRIGVGMGYRFDINSRIDFFYLYQKYLTTSIPRERFVMGVTYKLRVF